VPELLVRFVESQLGCSEPGTHFALDFGTALLANILHAPSTQAWLSKNSQLTQNLVQRLLNLVHQDSKIQTSHLMHLLICLSYLKQHHSDLCENKCQFSDQISLFVERYSQKPTS